ncbi:tyrosine-type recombinase/integrase [Porphyrobacter sp. CACIAM 03H1]|uniref:tyrosine-type recombinase/integrase n=1 Tax=Porphyrobacter sp. CACIAM 03H1 TaxID=2003315 RepID=UPI000B5AB67B|nr:site-specific integrase [Porphyrobacter sp. CACIAM 03H1]ASJ91140.1 integrase [Porphyrobacter sp. CACIAM 03H1]
MGKLTVAKVKNAKPGIGKNGQPIKATFQDGEGLFLNCAPTGAKSWILRVQADGKRRDIGLGAADVDGAGREAFGAGDDRLGEASLMLKRSLTLAEAREKAAALRKLAKAGANPVLERDRKRKRVPTFAEAMKAAHEALKAGWSEKTAKAFETSLADHALPKLGALRVDAIGSAEVIGALAPIWTEKPMMARKVRSRIGQVLAYAKAQGWRAEALPDVRELRSGLSKQKAGKHFEAVPFIEVPAFFAGEYAKGNAAGRSALLFAILTAARSGEARQATWEQIDLEARTWTLPAELMKMKRPHVVTLSDAAVALLEAYTPEDMREGLIFRGARGKPLTDMALSMIMRSAGRTETVHGFRSSFRDWAAEKMPTIPAMVAEMALAHKVGTATEQAYLRSDLRDMRRALMDAWGRHVAPQLSGVADNVTAIGKAAAN